MPRYWGFWTRGKLELLRRYLDGFTTASNRVSERIYLDVFGGQPDNRDRLTDELLDGSARLALRTSDPGFTRLRFFELEPYARRLEAALRADFPDRDFEVVPGDCNQTVAPVLADLTPFNWAPTFAFIDPNGPDAHWTTLEAIAGFKRSGTTKAEIWLLLAAGMFMRTLPLQGPLRPADANKLTRMYGSDQWWAIYEGRLRGDLAPADAREEYVNLMRWRMQTVLGYEWTHPLEVFNERGNSIYHMIFATDHEAGNRIMAHLYTQAADEFPAMRTEARRRRGRMEEEARGVMNLFGDDLNESATPVRRGERLYEYSPPWMPYGTSDI